MERHRATEILNQILVTTPIVPYAELKTRGKEQES